MCTPSPSKTIVFRGGFIIGIGDFWEHSAHGNIRESLLGSAGVGSCLGISNQCKLVLDNQQAEINSPATDLNLVRFWPFPFECLLCHLSTQVNNGILAA